MTVVAATLPLALATGCVYRPTIQQGNLLELDQIEQVQVGMTRSQVRYILGTPMVSDPFRPDRWDYVYTLQTGREKHVDRTHFVVYFDGDKVSRVEKLGIAPSSATAQRVNEERKAKAEAESRAKSSGTSAAPAPGSAPATTPSSSATPPPAAPPSEPAAPTPPPAQDKPPGG